MNVEVQRDNYYQKKIDHYMSTVDNNTALEKVAEMVQNLTEYGEVLSATDVAKENSRRKKLYI